MIGLGYNAVPSQAEALLLDVFRSGQFSPGPRVKEFESAFARLHHARHAVFVNSGTDALRLSLLALKEKYRWPDGSEVVVPAITFVATVNIVLQAGLTPRFVDVGMTDALLNPWKFGQTTQGEVIEEAWKKVKAILPVHLFGKPCHPRIFDLAKKYDVKILEDSCETILNPLKGDIGCHSTYMAHHVTTGVGGIALTNDDELRELIWSYANHGRREPKAFVFDRIGYSSRPTEFEAALGLAQLPYLEENVRKRRVVAKQLIERLSAHPALFVELYNENHTYMMLPVLVRSKSSRTKQEWRAHLAACGIETREMMPVTNQPCYRAIFARLRDQQQTFSVANEINRTGFYLPCHPGISTADIQNIAEALDIISEVV